MNVKKLTIKSLLFIVVGFFIFAGLNYMWNGYVFGMTDLMIAKRLQPITIKLKNANTTDYRNQNWCSYFRYNKGLFSKNPTDDSCNIVFSGSKTRIEPFSPTEQQDFNELKHQLAMTGINVNMLKPIRNLIL